MTEECKRIISMTLETVLLKHSPIILEGHYMFIATHLCALAFEEECSRLLKWHRTIRDMP